MIRKLVVLFIVGACLIGITPVFAQKVYSTLAEYEKLTGNKIEEFNEAPMFRIKVAAGELPPVEQRLPEEPLVVEPEEIGQYGGTFRSAALGPTSGGADNIHARMQNLFKLGPEIQAVYPNIAKGWDFSEDYKVLTLYLRKGMKWSDGAPFTAADIMFWYEDIMLNEELTPVRRFDWFRGKERLLKLEKIDDYTVRFEWPEPYPLVVFEFGQGSLTFSPKHYMKKWHIAYNPDANELAKDEGFDTWVACLSSHIANQYVEPQKDMDLPTVYPWVLKEIDSFGNRYFERNPYYWKIDTAGNQLPYIDEQARMLVGDIQVLNLKTIAGEFDVAAAHLMLMNYPLYKQGEEKGSYQTTLWPKPIGAEIGLLLNFTCNNPVLRKIFNELKFRQAASLAINRGEINDTLFFGKGTPRQATISAGSFYEDWMGEYYAEYDPKRANELLDEMGLAWDGEHEYRLQPDGKTLTLILEFAREEGPKGEVCELIKEYWEEVGIKVVLKEDSKELFFERVGANEIEVGAWSCNENVEWSIQTHNATQYRVAWHWFAGTTQRWWDWFKTAGEKGEEPPEVIKRLEEVCDKWLISAPGTEEYLALGREMLTINVENLFVIGTVGKVPKPVVINNNLRNTPEKGVYDYQSSTLVPSQPDQWFFQK